MHPKWIITLAIMFLGGTVLSGLLEMSYVGSGEITIFSGIMTAYEHVDFTNPFVGLWSVAKVGWNFLELLWNMFWWNYSFFYGDYEIIRYFCWTLSIGVGASLLLAWVRGTSSA